MFYQNVEGIYVYHYDCIGELFTQKYDNIDHYLRHTNEHHIKTFVVHDINKHHPVYITSDYLNGYALIVCDADGKIYTSDRLVGLKRVWHQYCLDWNNNRYGRSNGQKRRVYGGYRKIQTFQERQQWFNVDEYQITGRAKRSASMLPNYWDDIHLYNDKSWKTQSKRKHQYK